MRWIFIAFLILGAAQLYPRNEAAATALKKIQRH